MDPEAAERARLLHALAEAWQVIAINLPGLREHVLTFEGRQVLDELEEAVRRCPALFDRIRKLI